MNKSNNRHPIKWHSKRPTRNFHPMPNDLARDESISDTAYRVLSIIYSHNKDFEVSAAGIAKAMGRGRDTIGKYLTELENARLLVIEWQGHLVTDYHVKPDGARFTDDEVARLRGKKLPPPTKAGTMPSTKAAPCPEPRQHPALNEGRHHALNQGTKEDKQENQLEDKVENKAEMPQPPPEADACVRCQEPFGQKTGSQKIDLYAAEIDGPAHQSCFLDWLFGEPSGMALLDHLQAGTPGERQQIKKFAAEYRSLLKRRLTESRATA